MRPVILELQERDSRGFLMLKFWGCLVNAPALLLPSTEVFITGMAACSTNETEALTSFTSNNCASKASRSCKQIPFTE